MLWTTTSTRDRPLRGLTGARTPRSQTRTTTGTLATPPRVVSWGEGVATPLSAGQRMFSWCRVGSKAGAVPFASLILRMTFARDTLPSARASSRAVLKSSSVTLSVTA